MNLPQELVDLVIDFVAAGPFKTRKILEACSLTCRAWRDRSQYHMQRQKAIRFFRGHNNLRVVNLPPRILRMIRDLTLEFARSNKYPSHEEWSLISKLTNLRSLVLLGSRIPSGVNQANLKPLEALFQRVTKLRLVECTFRNSSSFLSFIATFPNIQSLCINDVRLIGTNGLHDIPSNAPRPMLRELKVYEPTTEDKAARFLELCGSWLSMLSIDVLRTVELHVQINYMDPGVSLQPVLKALGPYLHRLTIDCQTPISDNVEECACSDPILLFDSTLN